VSDRKGRAAGDDQSLSSVEAPPKASLLIESMRDIGYSLETALADVIDNSITAGAKTIRIHVDTAGREVWIGILDDGSGMTKAELLDSMRLGSRHPQEQRSHRDLGRFGLGLKTASFSQCRRLTVVARKGNVTSAAIWDLDHVARDEKWSLLIPHDLASIPLVDTLGSEGVLVVWERLDRAMGDADSESARKHFVRRVDEARQYLELVFHRYLSGEKGLPRVTVLLNNQALDPFDPFNSAHTATMRGQTEKVPVGNQVVEITPFTLPHHRNVTQAEWEKYAGSAGYLKNQGFYLYRERRLIVHGTWFGLARQMELTKLARVRIDIPNSLDAEWNVDIKKASARPPLPVRERLQSIINELGAPSRTVYTRRGARLYDSRLPIWQRVQENNAIVYRLNADNPVLGQFREHLPAIFGEEFSRLLHAISSGLPMDAIFADLAGTPENVTTEALDDETLKPLVDITYKGLASSGVNQDLIPHMLRVIEPFRSNWERVEIFVAEIEGSRDP
jgi:hypothetical protein